MTRKEALIELRDKVAVGKLPESIFHGCSGERGHWAYETGLSADERRNVFLAYRGSLDAALALQQAVLPGWEVETFNLSGEVVLRRSKPVDTAYGEALRAGNPARAWLLALLSALISECEE